MILAVKKSIYFFFKYINVAIKWRNNFILDSQLSLLQYKLFNLSIFNWDIISKCRNFILNSLNDILFVFLMIYLHLIEFIFYDFI